MAHFCFFKRKNPSIKIENLISKDYEQKYFGECKYIWKNFVPQTGQADNLQGELLREIEKIRCEAQDNGNINWDEDYAYFCDFITESLTEQDIFSEVDKSITKAIMTYLKECGQYAMKFKNKKISEESVEINKIAYTEENLYDIICDQIGFLQRKHPSPISYEINDKIKR